MEKTIIITCVTDISFSVYNRFLFFFLLCELVSKKNSGASGVCIVQPSGKEVIRWLMNFFLTAPVAFWL